jgi:uncharacterized membrane protein YfcA
VLDSPWLIPLLAVTGFVGGLVDSIAGGGGLITIPLLLGVGLPPHMVLGTNKFQASFGSYTASHYYVRGKVVHFVDARLGIGCTVLGAALGSWSVQRLESGVLNVIIPFLLLAVALYMLFTPSLGGTEASPRFPRTPFYLLSGIGFGFYDGFFGPGVGSFWAMAFVVGLGFSLTKATGYTKVMNFTSNLVSLGLFVIGGHVLFSAGITMALGQIMGAKIGSGLVIRKGAKFIRPTLVAIVILTALKLLYDRLS